MIRMGTRIWGRTPQSVLQIAARTLKEGRRARLEGKLALALGLEDEGSHLLFKHFPDLAEDLLESWEGAYCDKQVSDQGPQGLMAWVIARKNANVFFVR